MRKLARLNSGGGFDLLDFPSKRLAQPSCYYTLHKSSKPKSIDLLCIAYRASGYSTSVYSRLIRF